MVGTLFYNTILILFCLFVLCFLDPVTTFKFILNNMHTEQTHKWIYHEINEVKLQVSSLVSDLAVALEKSKIHGHVVLFKKSTKIFSLVS